ncbi:hypothetical protein [Bradyrhizobium sp. RT9b]
MSKTSKKAQAKYAERIATEFDEILPFHEIFYIRAISFATERAL